SSPRQTPKTHVTIAAGAGECVPIRRDRQGVDPAAVTVERSQESAVWQAPEAYSVVGAAAGQQISRGRSGQAANFTCVARERGAMKNEMPKIAFLPLFREAGQLFKATAIGLAWKPACLLQGAQHGRAPAWRR